MAPSENIELVIERLAKLEEVVKKIAKWTHFNQPLDIGTSTTIRFTPGAAAPTPPGHGQRPQRSCRKQTTIIPTTTTKNTQSTMMTRATRRKRKSRSDSEDEELENQCFISNDDDKYPDELGGIIMKVEEDEFALIPDSQGENSPENQGRDLDESEREWTHFNQPLLDIGPPTIKYQTAAALSTASLGHGQRPQRSCRKQSAQITTRNAKKAQSTMSSRAKRRKRRSSSDSEDEEQVENQCFISELDKDHEHLDTVGSVLVKVEEELENQCLISELDDDEPDAVGGITIKVEEDEFAIIPDSQEENSPESEGSDFSFEFVEGEENQVQVQSQGQNSGVSYHDRDSVTTANKNEDQEEIETPGLLVLDSSRAGKFMVAYKGFLYKCARMGSNKKLFSCHRACQNGCKGRIHVSTNLKTVLQVVNCHNHATDQDLIDTKHHISRIKFLATTSNQPPGKLLAEELAKLSPSSKKLLPNELCIKRTIRRIRNRTDTASAQRIAVTSRVEIPANFGSQFCTENGESFLKWDSGIQSDSSDKNARFLICSTQSNLDFLTGCDLWLIDGDFKRSPPLFDQLMIVYGAKTWINAGTGLPLAYFLLPNRDGNTYSAALSALRGLRSLDVPNYILSDYDTATRNAISTIFPHTNVGGNFFAFVHANWNYIRGEEDLYQNVNTVPEFKLHVWILFALAFLPPDDVHSSYLQLVGSPFFLTHGVGLLKGLLDYFSANWMGRHGNQSAAQFPIQSWNCYGSILDHNNPKFNLTKESYHSTFVSHLTGQKPTIYKLMDALLKTQKLTDAKLNLFNTNTNKPEGETFRNKKLTQLEGDLKKLVIAYPQRNNIVEYLEGIAKVLIKLQL